MEAREAALEKGQSDLEKREKEFRAEVAREQEAREKKESFFRTQLGGERFRLQTKPRETLNRF